jgi:GNAT superfamily N-acetyltransferase
VTTETIKSGLQIALLGPEHDRQGFACGVESLDRYLHTQAGQDVRRKANAVFILTQPDAPTAVLGYYTLCAIGLAPTDVPESAKKHLPRYPQISATLIGRLAVAKVAQGQGLGSILLADAIKRAAVSATSVGSSMLVVDAIDDRAAEFYQAHAFRKLPDSMRLIMPMSLIATLAHPGT